MYPGSGKGSFILVRKRHRFQDFPEEEAPTPRGRGQHTILPNFPKNCMKLKEFGPLGKGGREGRAPLRSATGVHREYNLMFTLSSDKDQRKQFVFVYGSFPLPDSDSDSDSDLDSKPYGYIVLCRTCFQ